MAQRRPLVPCSSPSPDLGSSLCISWAGWEGWGLSLTPFWRGICPARLGHPHPQQAPLHTPAHGNEKHIGCIIHSGLNGQFPWQQPSQTWGAGQAWMGQHRDKEAHPVPPPGPFLDRAAQVRVCPGPAPMGLDQGLCSDVYVSLCGWVNLQACTPRMQLISGQQHWLPTRVAQPQVWHPRA